jgi:hypothetical protein
MLMSGTDRAQRRHAARAITALPALAIALSILVAAEAYGQTKVQSRVPVAVSIVNNPEEPVVVVTESPERFTSGIIGILPDSNLPQFDLVVVPGGKTLVIEHVAVSIDCQGCSPDTKGAVTLLANSGDFAEIGLMEIIQRDSDEHRLILARNTHLFLGQCQTLGIGWLFTETLFGPQVNAKIFGHYEPTQQTPMNSDCSP